VSNLKPGRNYENMRKHVLYIAAQLFLERGYSATTLKSIATQAQINIGSLMHLFGSKEELLCELVRFVLEGQFTAAAQLLQEIPHDPVSYYAVETVLQLHMAESHAYIRELYAVAYSLPKSAEIIHKAVTGKLERIFGAYLPDRQTHDFYMLEIASGGMIAGFMAIPCDMWFTMERKVTAFLEAALRIYCVPEEKIQSAIAFAAQFDFPAIAQRTIDGMVQRLRLLSENTPIDQREEGT